MGTFTIVYYLVVLAVVAGLFAYAWRILGDHKRHTDRMAEEAEFAAAIDAAGEARGGT